ncbi:polyamine aminopropyltransferase [Aestuariispira ectoiniformans]|uniref:polyamine aminopropyltransferase n=1 Tax=Aestuariispira ectoiniformans TaxID=2775080 RepID=UPI00223B9AE5|nr:polyamine aminopropyltransferase [Aestuariispira ectoiniformans]
MENPEYFDEVLHGDYGQRLKVERVLYRDKTEHQDLIIFENARFGRVMALDGIVQTTEGDEHIYHEMMAHVPILAHGQASRVLIVGGGDGGMAREVLKHKSVEELTMVEIDGGVVDFCREYLPNHNAGAFDDPRFNLVITDGCKFVKETDKRFDVIIIDSTDPIGPGAVLFTEEFYADCKSCLTENGILVTQNGVPAVQGFEVTNSWERMGPHYKDVAFYLATVPTYQGGPMAFGWATDDVTARLLPVAEIEKRFQEADFETRYYTPAVHVAAFALPRYVSDLLV